MTLAPPKDGQFSTIAGGFPKSSVAQSQNDPDELYNMSQFGVTQNGVMNYPYMCDQQAPHLADQELQFADKIKMMNSQKAQAPSRQAVNSIAAASGDPLSTILI
jgi:hypothetical protein